LVIELPISQNGYRQVAKNPYIALKNRFLEPNGTLSTTKVSAISRPGLKKFAEVGDGPIRKVYSTSGLFDNHLFVVSGTELHKVSPVDGTSSLIGTISVDTTGSVTCAATAPIGDTVPAFLFITEGEILWVYTDNGQALGHLQRSASVLANDVVRVGDVYYKFVSSGLDSGAPAGTVGNPWNVALGALPNEPLENLFFAINGTGEPGVTYSTALSEHPTAIGYSYNSTDLYVAAKDFGIAGNAIATTETSSALAWGAATLAGGGDEMLRPVFVPDDAGAVSVAHINSYIIVIPVQSDATHGRFYWIKPGEITIDALDYATAERAPDQLHQVVVFGDMFWLLGEKTTEPWITTGNPDFPMSRFTGILFDRGSWDGTAIQVKDSLIVVDEEGEVFQIAGSGQKKISVPAVTERIRRAMQLQALYEL
jgi:hypothetical protein